MGLLDHGNGGDPTRQLLPEYRPGDAASRGRPTCSPATLARGKGTDQLLRNVRMCTKQQRDTAGPLTCLPARFQAAKGPLREFLPWVEQPAHGVGATLRRVQQEWVAPRRCHKVLRVLGPAYGDLEPGGTHDRMAALEPTWHLHAMLVGMVRDTFRA